MFKLSLTMLQITKTNSTRQNQTPRITTPEQWQTPVETAESTQCGRRRDGEALQAADSDVHQSPSLQLPKPFDSANINICCGIDQRVEATKVNVKPSNVLVIFRNTNTHKRQSKCPHGVYTTFRDVSNIQFRLDRYPAIFTIKFRLQIWPKC